MRVYHCPNCYQYHLTSQGKRVKAQGRTHMLTPIAKKWESTGLFSDLTSDSTKNALSNQFELVIREALNDNSPHELVIEGIIPVVRLAFLRNKGIEPDWLYQDFKTWLQSNKLTALDPSLIESYVTQLP